MVKTKFSFVYLDMTDDALFDVFDQEEPSAVIELPKNVTVIEQATAVM
jgi:hypothetical protein